jgi:hypothetical protein
MTCFTESELEAMEGEAQLILEKTVEEAVDAAVAPHLVYETDLAKDVKQITFDRNFWRVAGVSGWILAFIVTIVAVVR